MSFSTEYFILLTMVWSIGVGLHYTVKAIKRYWRQHPGSQLKWHLRITGYPVISYYSHFDNHITIVNSHEYHKCYRKLVYRKIFRIVQQGYVGKIEVRLHGVKHLIDIFIDATNYQELSEKEARYRSNVLESMKYIEELLPEKAMCRDEDN